MSCSVDWRTRCEPSASREIVHIVRMLGEIQEMAQVLFGQRLQDAPGRGRHGNG